MDTAAIQIDGFDRSLQAGILRQFVHFGSTGQNAEQEGKALSSVAAVRLPDKAVLEGQNIGFRFQNGSQLGG